jgi:glycosyltransferase involved in cell wall biosynthesis
MTTAAMARRRRGTASDDPRPHVVFCVSSLWMGGAESQLTSLLEFSGEHLAGKRVTILTVTERADPTLRRRLEALDLKITTVGRPGRPFLAFFLDLVRWFRRERPDLVHTLMSGTVGTWGRLAARLAGVPRVVHSELSLAHPRTRVQRSLEPFVNRFTLRFFPNAHAIAQRLMEDGVPEGRIRVIRNGVDLDRFSTQVEPRLRAGWHVTDDDIVVGFLGMLRKEKRPDLLLDAVTALPAEHRPALVAIAGDGVLMPGLRARVDADPWLHHHVRLLGLVTDTPGFLASIDVLVLTSDTEGLPNAIVEAMAAGVPCIGTRVSDVPDLIGDPGLVVEPGDAQALATAIRKLLRLRRGELRELGQRGRDRAVREFGLAAAAAHFWAAHDEALAVGNDVTAP